MSFQALKKSDILLTCAGSAHERGVQQGKRYRKQIGLTFNAFFQSDLYQLIRSQWLPIDLAVKWSCAKSHLRFKRSLKEHAPEFLDYLLGLSEGSGRPFSQFLFFASLDELLAHTPYQLGGCTSLAVPPAFSSTQEPLMIKNFDYPYFLRHSTIVRKSVPSQGLRSLEVSLGPWAGCHAGLNEAGVAIAFNYAHYQDKTPFWFPTALRIQQALQNCKTAEEVVAFFKAKKQSGGAVLSVIDAQGSLYSIELSPHKVVAKRVENNILIFTNHYQHADMQSVDIPSNAYYAYKKNVSELAGKRIKESSESRFDRLFDLTGTKIQFHESDLKTYFQDHEREAYANDNTICRHGELYETTASLIFKPLQREIQVALGSPCETTYQSFQLL